VLASGKERTVRAEPTLACTNGADCSSSFHASCTKSAPEISDLVHGWQERTLVSYKPVRATSWLDSSGAKLNCPHPIAYSVSFYSSGSRF